jgi:hypothetical protein
MELGLVLGTTLKEGLESEERQLLHRGGPFQGGFLKESIGLGVEGIFRKGLLQHR